MFSFQENKLKLVALNNLGTAISKLAQAVGGLSPSSNAITKQDLKELEERIMSKLSTFLDSQEAAINDLTTTVNGIADGIAKLQKLIVDFQNSPDEITPKDQESVDRIEKAINALAAKAHDIKTDVPTSGGIGGGNTAQFPTPANPNPLPAQPTPGPTTTDNPGVGLRSQSERQAAEFQAKGQAAGKVDGPDQTNRSNQPENIAQGTKAPISNPTRK